MYRMSSLFETLHGLVMSMGSSQVADKKRLAPDAHARRELQDPARHGPVPAGEALTGEVPVLEVRCEEVLAADRESIRFRRNIYI